MTPHLLPLKLRAMESRHYWRLRSQIQGAATRVASARIAARSRTSDFSTLVRIAGCALAKSVLRIFLPLLVLDLTQSVVRLHGVSASWLRAFPKWVDRFLEWITSPVPRTFDAAALPTAAVGVAGVFVAVYFATVTFVVSTTYKDATRNLRDQIVRQPESGWYADFFTQAVVYVALALALPVVDRTPTHLTLVLAGLSGALVVLSFGRIWITLFVSLEPTALFPTIRRDLNRWVQRAHKLGTRRNPSPTAVRRAKEKIRDKLETLNDLVTLILDREYERAADRGIAASFDPRLRVVAWNLLIIWQVYAVRKHTIRTLPGWNPTRTQAKDWFLSSHSEVSVALATGTTLTSSEVVDDLWYEREVADIIERLLDGRDVRSVESVLRGMPPLSRVLGSRGQFDELRLWLTATTFAPMMTVSQYATASGPITPLTAAGDGQRSQLSRAEHFALPGEAGAHNLVDFVLLEALSACLGYIDYFQRIESLLPDIGSSAVDDAKRVVAGKVVIQIVNDLRQALATEASIEGQRVTPDNALTHLVSRVLATESIDEIEQFLTYLEKELWPWVIDIGGSKSWAAGAALSRATELTEKLGTMLRLARRLLDSCENAHIEKDDRWPDTDTSKAFERAKLLGARLELPVARLATTVDSAPDSDRPDHFGWAYYRAHENVLRRVLSREPGEPEELRQQVGLLYWSCDLATQRLSSTVRRHDQGVINSYVSEPYLRFLQLCGIALVLSQVAAMPTLFQPFESLWVGLLGDASRANQLLERAAATLASGSGFFGLTPGGIERSNIEMRAHDTLEKLGVPRDLIDFGGLWTGQRGRDASLSDEAKRLVRAAASSNFEGMFYARWLRPRAVAAGATVPGDLEKYLDLLDLHDQDESHD